MIKRLLSAIFLFIFSILAFALTVDREELQDEKPGLIVFQNYEGELQVYNTAEEIREIGRELARRRSTQGLEASVAGRYFIRRILSFEGEEGFSADILLLGSSAGVDHIDNIKRILSGYLQEEFGYTQGDADSLSEMIVLYNAKNRGNLSFFVDRYSKAVSDFLEEETVGLSINYSQWPGYSTLVIPLSEKPTETATQEASRPKPSGSPVALPSSSPIKTAEPAPGSIPSKEPLPVETPAKSEDPLVRAPEIPSGQEKPVAPAVPAAPAMPQITTTPATKASESPVSSVTETPSPSIQEKPSLALESRKTSPPPADPSAPISREQVDEAEQTGRQRPIDEGSDAAPKASFPQRETTSTSTSTQKAAPRLAPDLPALIEPDVSVQDSEAEQDRFPEKGPESEEVVVTPLPSEVGRVVEKATGGDSSLETTGQEELEADREKVREKRERNLPSLKEIVSSIIRSPLFWVIIILLILSLLVFLLYKILQRKRETSGSFLLLYGSKFTKGLKPVILYVYFMGLRLSHKAIQSVPPNAKRTVGGPGSDFSIYGIQLPKNIGEIVNENGSYSFKIINPKYFLTHEKTISNCLGRFITVIDSNGKEIVLQFDEYVSPLEEINAIMRSVKYSD